MAYFSNGKPMEGRPWSLSAVVAMFWEFINFIVLFFKTLVNPSLNKQGSGYSTTFTHVGRPAQRGRTIGRVHHGGSSGPKAPPMAGGG